MKISPLALLLGLIWPVGILASAYGDLNNFDAVNDTGQECHGLEIELDGIHSTDITYTYDWSRYGPPTIREDLAADGVTPRVFIRFASAKDAAGNFTATTQPQDPANPFPATAGHQCTDPAAVPAVCDHFGVGYYPTAADPTTTPPTPAKPSLIRYNWLVSDPQTSGMLILGPALNVATPVYTYQPPVAAQPAQVQAVIQAPPPPQPELAPLVQMAFGDPVWAKEIKTSSKNNQPIKLEALVDDDPAVNNEPNWLNDKQGDGILVEAQTEVEWRMMQTEFAKMADPNQPGGANGALAAAAEDLPGGDEIVTRRYEFYRYAADDLSLNPALGDIAENVRSSLDGETGEAMCSEVNPTTDPNDPAYLHGVGTEVTVTGPNGDSYPINCSQRIVVGNYIGAQMAAFNPASELGLVANLQPWDTTQPAPYPARRLIVGGTEPYHATINGNFPAALALDASGILAPIAAPTDGTYLFNISVTDSATPPVTVSRDYQLLIGNPDQPRLFSLNITRNGNGSGKIYAPNNLTLIDCPLLCQATLPAASSIALQAVPDTGSQFSGWGNSGCDNASTGCTLTLNSDQSLTAQFTLLRQQLTISKSGSGTVSGTGIDCGTSCSATFDYGTSLSLTATPASGYLFSGWSGGCSGSTSPCSVVLNQDQSVTASFVPQPSSYPVTVSVTGSGTVTSSPKGISCGRSCSAQFKTGTKVTLTAQPAKKHTFKSWSGTVCNGSTATSCSWIVNQNVSLAASFN